MTSTTDDTLRYGPGLPLAELLAGEVGAFAVLHRPETTGDDRLELLAGDVRRLGRLADLPLAGAARPGHHEFLVLVPYRQLTERGFSCRDDGEPLLAMSVHRQATVPLPEALAAIPDEPVDLSEDDFDLDDERYADLVRRVVAEVIGRGEGANFVLKRSYRGALGNYSPRVALTLLRRLLSTEVGAHWTFLVHTGDRTLLGATPERHVTVSGGVMAMNPISGTYRYPPEGPTLDGVLRFLADHKETDELYMVVDEELKMMARACEHGGRVHGPYLKQMAHLAHTEYLLEGRTRMDVRDILRETMFAPTVTGSPLENACRVISRYERRGRGYYSGALALTGWDAAGDRTLDSAIVIRTADIDRRGRFDIGVGATLVRHSDPMAEAAETRAKAAALLRAFRGAPITPRPAADQPVGARLDADPRVRRLLAERNSAIAPFWLGRQDDGALVVPELAGRRVLVVDAEDTFTAMMAHQIRALGPLVTVRRYDEPLPIEHCDLVVMGPGPGDPADTAHPKIKALRDVTGQVLADRVPLLAVCLGHQVLAALLGLRLVRLPRPNQGAQHEIDFFGARLRAGFYNTFAAYSPVDVLRPPAVPGPVLVSRDPATGHVYGLRGRGLASTQFHPESVLTLDGPGILTRLLTALLPASALAG